MYAEDARTSPLRIDWGDVAMFNTNDDGYVATTDFVTEPTTCLLSIDEALSGQVESRFRLAWRRVVDHFDDDFDGEDSFATYPWAIKVQPAEFARQHVPRHLRKGKGKGKGKGGGQTEWKGRRQGKISRSSILVDGQDGVVGEGPGGEPQGGLRGRSI